MINNHHSQNAARYLGLTATWRAVVTLRHVRQAYRLSFPAELPSVAMECKSMASENIARQMAAAPVESKRESKEAKGNPIAKLLGIPTFRLVTNPKWYDDKNDKSKQSMRVAFCDFALGGLTLSASVYLERKIEQKADGRHAQTYERMSLPKGLAVSKDDAETIVHLEAFKNTVLDGFDAWKTTVETGSGGKIGRASGGRFVSDGLIDA